jgi:hypothetical protein
MQEFLPNPSKMKSTKQIILVMIGLLFLSSITWAQIPTSYQCSVRNDFLVSPRVYEFDVYLQNLDAFRVFELASFYGAINFNPAIVNGGEITMEAVPGSSELVAAQQPTLFHFEADENYMEIWEQPLTGETQPGHGLSTIISRTTPGTRVVRIRLTNSVDFGEASPDFTFKFTDVDVTFVKAIDQTSPYPVTNITDQSFHTTAAMYNPVLNAPVTSFSMTGTDDYCIDDIDGEPIGLSGSQTGVIYQLFRNGVVEGSPVPGTGSAITFGDFLQGTYTASGVRAGTFLANDMTGSAVLTEKPLPAAVLSGTATICEGSGTTLSVDLDGTAPWNITYTANGAAPVTLTGIMASPFTFDVSPSSTTTYAISNVTDANSCEAVGLGTAVVTVDEESEGGDLLGIQTICAESPIANLNSNGRVGAILYWEKSLNSSFDEATPIEITSSVLRSSDIEPLEETSYFRVVVKNGVCPIEYSDVVTVTVNPLPEAETSADRTICLEESTTLGAEPITGETYSWTSVPTGFTSALANPVVTPEVTTIYSLEITITATGCKDVDEVTVTVNPLPEEFEVTGTESYCIGTPFAVDLSGSETGINYALILDNEIIGTPIAGTGSPISFTALTVGGTYTIVAVNPLTGCHEEMDGEAVITLLPLPAVFTLTSSGEVCEDEDGLMIGLSGSELTFDYELYRDDVEIAVLPGTGEALDFGLQTAVGVYTIEAVNHVTDCDSEMTGSATIYAEPLPFDVTGGGEYCAGGEGLPVGLSNSEIGVNYQLFIGGTAPEGTTVGSPVPGTGSAISFGLITAGGEYFVEGTRATTLCETDMNLSATIVVNPLPAAFAGNNITICKGSTIELGADEVGANTYSWTSSVGGFVSTDADPEVTPLVNTTYMLVETMEVTGCTNTHSVVVTVNLNTEGGDAELIDDGELVYEMTICSGSNPGILLIDDKVGTLLTWQKSSDPEFTVPIDITGNTIGVLTETTYFRAVVKSGVCDSEFSSVATVNVTSVPTPVISTDGNTLTSTAVSGNQWYLDGSPIAGAVNQTYVPETAGEYYVVSTLNGCISANSNPITVLLTDLEVLFDDTEFEIYPVPNDGHFTVTLKSQKSTNFDIMVIDALGSKVLELKKINVMDQIEKNIDISSHGPGLYYVVFRSGDKQVYKKVIVRK